MAESLGMEVLAFDLAYGIEQAYGFNKNPFVYFVQGSVSQPPVKGKAVDIVYCAGVLVHVQEPKPAFTILKSLVKPGKVFRLDVPPYRPGTSSERSTKS